MTSSINLAILGQKIFVPGLGPESLTEEDPRHSEVQAK